MSVEKVPVVDVEAVQTATSTRRNVFDLFENSV